MTKVEMILAQVDGLLDAAYEVVNGRKTWKDVTPLVNIAAEMLMEERKDYYTGIAYWVICEGTEKEMLDAKDTLEGLGLHVEDYYWHDADEYDDTPGGHMSVYWTVNDWE